MKKLLTLLLLAGFTNLFGRLQPKVVGYYTSWAQFRDGMGKFVPEDIDGDLLTHAIYAFAKIGAGGNVLPLEHNDLSTAKTPGMYQRFNKLKSTYPHLKTLISIGGENLKGAAFIDVLSDNVKRRYLARQLVEYAKEHNFDGVDIDWEYEKKSAKQGSKCSLLVDFLGEINQIAKKMGYSDFLVTVVVGLRTIGGTESCIANVADNSDWLNVIGYDFHGAWDSYTDANAPLYADNFKHSTYYIDHLIKKYLKEGISPEKLVLGVPAYGRSYGNVLRLKESVRPRNSSNGPGAKGKYTKQDGILSFYEVDARLRDKTFVRGWDEVSSTPYAHSVLDKEWVSFEDAMSAALKAKYVKKMGLGGVMLWALPLDDFKNGYPLLSAINRELV